MNEAEQIALLFTFGGCALTIVKVYRKHTKWYWNLAPFIVGFTSCLWITRIMAG